MERWVELRTAYQVAKLGTVSAAAEALGVHRATVNRHIDALEGDLGAKLFQRHGRGYVLTEIGEQFLSVAQRADELFTDFAGRTRAESGELTGEVIVTVSPALAQHLMPAISAFRQRHPNTQIRLLAQDSLARLEYGEAHVALRAGQKPDHGDYVVQPFDDLRVGLYAHATYVARKGVPSGPSDFGSHEFIGNPDLAGRVPFETWMVENVPKESVVLTTTHPRISQEAIMAGIAIGFLPETYVRNRTDFHEVMSPHDDWGVTLWLVTHVDLHRTEKVQSMLACIKQTSLK
ncbi:MAG: LysR family transcriptional regulator [Pseudomonadota bacterium]